MIVVRSGVPDSALKSAPDGAVYVSSGGADVARATFEGATGKRLLAVEVTETAEASILDAMRMATNTVAPKVVGTTLFADRPMAGFAKVNGWIQIRPIETNQILDMTGEPQVPGVTSLRSIPNPISLEVYHRSSALWMLDAYRSQRALHEAICLMTTFLELPVHQLVQAYSYAMVDWKVALIRGVAPDLPNRPTNEFSDVSGLVALEPVEIKTFLDQLGVGHDEFRVPDLSLLWAAYSKLSPEKKLRFLRASANLREAANPAISNGGRIVASVFAIEALIARPISIGITKRFSKFVDEYVRPDPQVLAMYRTVYDSRSDIAHGRWQIAVDEPSLGLHRQYEWTPLVAWSAAKRGLINWLLAQ